MDDVRQRFLHSAAQRLCRTSPSTSAYLSTQGLSTNQLGSTKDSQQSIFCGTCGSLNTKAWNIKPATSETCGKEATTRPTNARPVKRVALRRCHVCGRLSKAAFDHTPGPVKAEKLSGSKPPRDSSPIPSSTVQQAKLSSKKRAKVRKDREGLQALLNKTKSAHSSSRMTLMDFMKP